MTSIDADLKRRAKQAQINISAITEDAIRDKLNTTTVEFDEPNGCDYCSRKELVRSKATEHFPTDGLCWLYPDERWICTACLRNKCSKIPIAVS